MCRACGASIPLIRETNHPQPVSSSETEEEWEVSQTDSVRDNILITEVGKAIFIKKIYS